MVGKSVMTQKITMLKWNYYGLFYRSYIERWGEEKWNLLSCLVWILNIWLYLCMLLCNFNNVCPERSYCVLSDYSIITIYSFYIMKGEAKPQNYLMCQNEWPLGLNTKPKRGILSTNSAASTFLNGTPRRETTDLPSCVSSERKYVFKLLYLLNTYRHLFMINIFGVNWMYSCKQTDVALELMGVYILIDWSRKQRHGQMSKRKWMRGHDAAEEES